MSYASHVIEWRACTRCRLNRDRLQVCLYRGEEPPVDILFIGEAPGQQDDELGEPFVGKDGKLLDSLIKEAGVKGSCGFTNTVACFPHNRMRIRKPNKEEVSTCWPRLEELIRICDPWHIVFVGKAAAQETRPIISGLFSQVKLHEMIHPSILLRRGRKGVIYGETIRLLGGLNEDNQD